MRFEELLDRHERGFLTQAEAGEMLGMTERTFRRWQVRYREEGVAGLGDRRVGKPSPRRADAGELARARALYVEMYDGFTVKHFHEKLVEGHGYRLGYTVTRLTLQAAGLVKRASRRGAHRRRRPRRPAPGMLLHQGCCCIRTRRGTPGSPAVRRSTWWSPSTTRRARSTRPFSSRRRARRRASGRSPRWSPTVASSARSTPIAGSHYFHTPVAGGRVDREHPTQVGRALAELGIEHIAAYSPQARGRSERAFRTLEDRLPKELALAGITEIEVANAWLRTVYLPAHNARFAVAAEEAGSAFVPAAPHQWRDVLCLREARQSATTTACAGGTAACRSRRARCARTSPAPPCACTNIPMARSRSSGDPTASPTSRLPAPMPRTARRDPLRCRNGRGQRYRVAHTTTTTEADSLCAT